MINNKFLKDIIVTLFGQIFLLITAFIINKILSVRLGVEEFGLYSITKRSATVLSFMTLFGLGISMPRFISMSTSSPDRGENEEASWLVAGMIVLITSTLLGWLLILIFREKVCELIYSECPDVSMISAVAIYAYGLAFSSFVYAFFRGTGNFNKFIITQTTTQISAILITILLNANYKFIIIAWGVSAFTVSLFFILPTIIRYDYLKLTYKSVTSRIKRVAIYGMPRLVGEGILFSFFTVPLIIINKELGTVSASLLSVSMIVLQAFVPFFSFVGYKLLPYVSGNFKENFGEVYRKVNFIILFFIALSLMISITANFFSTYIILTLFSKEYIESVPVFNILIFCLIPISIYLTLRNPIDAMFDFPFNTLNLSISFIILLSLVCLSNSIKQYAFSFLIAYIALGLLSILIWFYICFKSNKEIR